MSRSTTIEPSAHPERDELSAFLSGEDRPRCEEISRHLRQGCRRCAQAARDLLPATLGEGRTGIDEPGSGGLATMRRLGRRMERRALVIEQETRFATDLLAQLLRRLPATRRELIEERERFRTLGLARLLIEEAARETTRDVAQGLELADLAVVVAEALEPEIYTAGIVADARARAWAQLANAQRVASDHAAAEEAFSEARTHLEQGSGEPLEVAAVLSLYGSLLIDQGHHARASEVLGQVVEVYRASGELGLEGRSHLKLARAHGDGGETDRALEHLDIALTMIRAEDDPRLYYVALQNRLALLVDAGLAEVARRRVAEVHGALEAADGGIVDWFRVRWIEARIAASLDEPERAVDLFEEVRRGFLDRDMAYDFALATLELAAVHLEAGRPGAVRRLTGEMFPIFRSREVHRPAVAALMLFHRAAEAEQATVALVRDLASYLQRARKDPSLVFESSSSPS